LAFGFRSTATTLDLEIVVVTGGVEFGPQVVDQIRVGHVGQLCRGVVGLEGRQDVFRVVHEVQHVGRVLAGIRTVQPG
jgi:hypothetical protein